MMTPETLLRVMQGHGVLRLVAKRLAPNDNSKNQIYLGGDYTAIQLLPFGTLREDTAVAAGSKRARLKADVTLDWITARGALERAPGANLILYPKYPEVRLSGLLQGVRDRSSAAIVGPRGDGRWLFLGITAAATVVAYACVSDAPCARWGEAEVGAGHTTPAGVFHEFHLPTTGRDDLLTALRKVAERGWIDSKRLDREGGILPCNSPNCGGYTLEAELGIRPNGRSEPDYDGWELKQFDTADLAKPVGGRVTLMTPEPNGGYYVDAGPAAFVRRFGYADKSGVVDRFNFGGMHRFGIRHALTGLQMTLNGWDGESGRVTNLSGGVELVDCNSEVAARWSFESLLNHWKRKHAKAVYVPSNCEKDPRRYRYGATVLTGIGTDFPMLLTAFSKGVAFYDPGIKLVNASTNPELKRRSQFRILVRDLNSLYQKTSWTNLSSS